LVLARCVTQDVELHGTEIPNELVLYERGGVMDISVLFR
jgi:hypothetical protein